MDDELVTVILGNGNGNGDGDVDRIVSNESSECDGLFTVGKAWEGHSDS
jgi:hypothetical protein